MPEMRLRMVASETGYAQALCKPRLPVSILGRSKEGKEMSLPDELDCSYNDSPVCPWCGHEHQDAWEWPNDEHGDEQQCQNEDCEKWFSYSTETSRTFSTLKSCAPGEHNLKEKSRSSSLGGKLPVCAYYKCDVCAHTGHKIVKDEKK